MAPPVGGAITCFLRLEISLNLLDEISVDLLELDKIYVEYNIVAFGYIFKSKQKLLKFVAWLQRIDILKDLDLFWKC